MQVVVAGDINTKYPHSIAEVSKLMRESGYRSAFGDKHVRTHVIVGDLDWIFARGPVRLSDGKVHRDMPGPDHWAVSARLAGERVEGRWGTGLAAFGAREFEQLPSSA